MKPVASLLLSRRILVLSLMLAASQLALLGHQVLVDHDETVNCEICRVTQQVEWQVPAAEISLTFIALVFAVTAPPAASFLFAEVRRGYYSRAPPRH